MQKIALVYIESGGGHRAAANALEEVIAKQRRPWTIEKQCIQDVLDPIDFIRRFTGIAMQDVYNIMLRRGWTLGSSLLIRLSHFLIRLTHRQQVEVLERHWARTRPDMVVSMIPHYNRAMCEALHRACPGVPYVTIMTDIADYPPHFWIEKQDQWVVCGSRRAVQQAYRLGMPKERVLAAGGMILHPRFYVPVVRDRTAERIRAGLHPAMPTGIVSFGGEGSMDLVKIAKSMNRPGGPAQLIFICGRHARAQQELLAMKRHIPMVIEGFTRDIPYYMELADFFIGKPGPGSISEAFVKNLPVIVQRNAWTLVHERYNARWVEEQGAGMAIRSFDDTFAAVERLLAPGAYATMRARAEAIRNNAVFEIPDLLETVLADSGRERCPVTTRDLA